MFIEYMQALPMNDDEVNAMTNEFLANPLESELAKVMIIGNLQKISTTIIGYAAALNSASKLMI